MTIDDSNSLLIIWQYIDNGKFREVTHGGLRNVIKAFKYDICRFFFPQAEARSHKLARWDNAFDQDTKAL